jgi:cardiolipin synthase (CMP-forming)
MTTTTNPQASARAFALPNMLTYGRIVAVPLVVACMYAQSVLGYGLWLRWVALAIFIVAGITDVLDGYAARTYGQQSSFGRMLDPIADKLLVSSCLLMLAVDGTIKGLALWAAIIILCREILVSGLREYLAELRVTVQVTWLAKWKTFLQLLAVGFCIAGEAGDALFPNVTVSSFTIAGTGVFFAIRTTGIVTFVGVGLLWLSAILTLYTGWDYFRAGVRHLIDD